jgi:GxxExxY protein
MDNRQEAKGAKVSPSREPDEHLDDLARRVIGAAIEVHRHLGPGFPEGVYEEALAVEFSLRGIPFLRQPAIEVRYKGHDVGLARPDFVVGEELVVEIKAVAALVEVHHAQVISYLRSLGTSLGLLLNFKEATMRKGIKRIVWSRSRYREHQTRDADEAHEAREGLVVSGRYSPVPLQAVEEYLDPVA